MASFYFTTLQLNLISYVLYQFQLNLLFSVLSELYNQWYLFSWIVLNILMPIRCIISSVLQLIFLPRDNLCVSFVFPSLKGLISVCILRTVRYGIRVHVCVCVCECMCIQIKVFWLCGCRWILQVPQKYRKLSLSCLDFKYNFLPCLGRKAHSQSPSDNLWKDFGDQFQILFLSE